MMPSRFSLLVVSIAIAFGASAAAAFAQTPAASPGASSSPAASTLRLTRSSVAVAPRGIAAVGVSGAQGGVTIAVPGAIAAARYDAATSSIVVSGIALGTATVTVTDGAGNSAALAVSVLPPAGIVPADVTVSLGGTVSPQFALARIDAALVRAASLAPGGVVAARGITIVNTLRAGDEVEAIASVSISAGSAFADQVGTTAVHVRVETLDRLEPAFLFYSDDPEKLGSDGDGVLYRGTIDASKPARVYAYHVSDTPARNLYLALRTTGTASVQILGYAAGPANAFAYVGHVSTLQYLLERSTQESTIVDVAAATPYLQPLGYRALAPGELVSAIFDLRVTSGDPVDVEVVSTSGTADPAAVLGDDEHASDGHGRRGEFALGTVPPLALTYAAGDSEPAPFTIGVPTIANIRTGGRALGGDYGALRTVSLQLSNPGAAEQNVYFYEQAAGGTATTTIWFAGDDKPIEIPCVRNPQNRYLVKAFALAPGETRAVSGEYMTDGSSSFPLNFGVTMVAPSPPPGPYAQDACNPKTPPASPLPSASPSDNPPSDNPPSAEASPPATP